MIWDTAEQQRPAPVLKAPLTPKKWEEIKSVRETPKWQKLFSGCSQLWQLPHTGPCNATVNAGSSLRSGGANPWYRLGTLWTELRARARPRQGNRKWFVPRLRERRRFRGPRKRCGQNGRVTGENSPAGGTRVNKKPLNGNVI